MTVYLYFPVCKSTTMTHTFTRIFRLLLLLVFPTIIYGQTDDSRSLMLTTGKVVPVENISQLTKQSDVFSRSTFDGKHYVVVQFSILPSQAEKDRLKAAGIELKDYLPYNAYTAVLSQNFNMASLQSSSARSVLTFSPEQKAFSDVLNGNALSHAIKQQGFVDVTILTYELLNRSQVTSAIAATGASIVEEHAMFRNFIVRVPKDKVRQLADLPFVQWLEFIDPPNQPENLPGRTLHKANVLQDGVRNLKGDGMNIGIFDEIASQHLDFLPTGRMINVDAGTAGSHGTHVSGTVGGKGIINPIAKGMAPNATLYSYYGFSGDVQVRMATEIPAKTLISSNHSYHDGLGVQCSLTGASASYSLRARNTDINLNNFPYHLHCHSAGNAQTSCASGWLTITGTGKAAKNNVVVAAVTGFEAMTSYSSFGPVHDGRVKPEISAMGDGVFSTYTPLNSYGTISGTSMATPGITGTVALLAQRYKQLNGNVLPPSTLIKNTVCNTAKDLGNPGPDYKFGFGCINALSAVRILEENRYTLNSVGTGGTNDITINVPAGAARLRVMLTWNDPAAAANAALALVNNLDLRVIDPSSNAALPWILNPNSPANNATQADDNISNIEQVTINNPAAGTYTLRVAGEAVTTGPTQDYALTWDIEQPNIEVTYPNGGESLNPGTTQVISWTNAGVTSAQTVEYSLDNGATWTTISSSVAAATTRLNWSVPSANTSTARVRITSGSITDQSDNTFKILSTVTGFNGSGTTCNAGEVIFNWTAVANATHYDIYRLDPATGEFVLVAANIGGSPYTATGLTPNTSMWFTIRSKNNTTGAESQRANAINVTTSNGGGGLGAVGPISGNSTICGTQNGVAYNISAVSGATTYTWTAPPGAAVASGQGTTSVTINYPAGSSSGNISVTAGNGACTTAPSTLAVAVGNSSISAPASGGNQSQAVCPGGSIPTLTAVASVSSGYTVVWYSASTGGSVVSNPVLNSVGTVTYYAASKETSTNCESNSRTPVTLTITQVPAPSVSANGNTTFCQGQSVTLTASAGSSWTWSNGATTQSITVNSAGNYSVTVVNSGCTNTTAATAVTVNPVPTATITAGGPASFCDGGSVLLTASAGSSWAWSNGATSQSVTISTTGNYSVIVTNASGCSATSSATAVSVSPNPTVSISADPYTSLYPGLQTSLTASASPSGSYNYVWHNNSAVVPGATSASITGINLNNLGSYTVTVTNATGLPCSKTSNAVVISDSASSRLFIFPSPNNGQFTVSYYNEAANDVYTLTITDSKGALLYQKTNTVSSSYQMIPVDIRRHGGGLYIVTLHNKAGKKIATGKVLVQ